MQVLKQNDEDWEEINPRWMVHECKTHNKSIAYVMLAVACNHLGNTYFLGINVGKNKWYGSNVSYVSYWSSCISLIQL